MATSIDCTQEKRNTIPSSGKLSHETCSSSSLVQLMLQQHRVNVYLGSLTLHFPPLQLASANRLEAFRRPGRHSLWSAAEELLVVVCARE